MSRSFGIITTCSQAGWAEYGSRMVDSVLTFFPPDTKLYLYVDFKPPKGTDRLIVRSIPELCTDLVAFQNRLPALDFARGSRIPARGHENAHMGHIIWNAQKFSFKVFTVEHAVLQATEDVMIWLDADSLAFSTLGKDLLEKTIPTDCMIGYLGRSWKYSECGYVSYNLKHPLTKSFAQAVAEMYRSGSVFSLKEWHDSYVFDVVKNAFEIRLRVKTFNISADVAHLDHVFVNCELGRHLDHLKGPRKGEGRSRARDLITHGDVAYWTAGPAAQAAQAADAATDD